MKRSELSELRSRISEIVERSSLGGRARGVSVEAEEGVEGGDFLRVIVKLKGTEKLRYRQVAPLLKSIEESVAEVDERFPSVRFREAA